MSKMIALLILAALSAVLACGGSEALTVREYAEECGDLGVQLSNFSLDLDDIYIDDPDDSEEALEEIQDFFREYKRLNPPASLQDLHDARVELMDFLDAEMLAILEDALSLMEDALSALEDGDEDELQEIQEEMEAFEDEIEDLEEEFDELVAEAEEEFEDLSSRNQEILEDSDCG